MGSKSLSGLELAELPLIAIDPAQADSTAVWVQFIREVDNHVYRICGMGTFQHKEPAMSVTVVGENAIDVANRVRPARQHWLEIDVPDNQHIRPTGDRAYRVRFCGKSDSFEREVPNTSALLALVTEQCTRRDEFLDKAVADNNERQRLELQAELDEVNTGIEADKRRAADLQKRIKALK